MDSRKDPWDKLVSDVDRSWNCMKDTPIEFNIEKSKKTLKCLKGGM